MTEGKFNKLAARRAFIHAHVAHPKHVLEIGALNAPVFGNSANVRYADRFSTEELAERYPHKSNIRNVDYVLSRTRFSELIPERFECIIANHVIEHVPDLITWFDQIGVLVESEGWAFLAIPDKRYTFNIIRPLTTFADLLDCAHRELVAPSVGQIFSHLYLHRKVETQDIWDGKPVDTASPRIDLRKAVRNALSMAEQYHSVHCHVFTFDSFLQLVDDLLRAGLVDWVVHASQTPLPGSNEFLVALRKVSSS